MADYFGRGWKVVIGSSGNALEITDLRISFEVVKTRFSNAHTCKLSIYNLSETKRNEIKNGFTEEFSDADDPATKYTYNSIALYAGYGENVPLLFKGDITNINNIRIGVDWITEVYAADGIKALQTSKINKSFVKGSSPESLFKELVNSMPGIAQGSLDGILECIKKKRSILKSIIMSGSVRKFLDELAENCLFDYQVNDGVLDTQPRSVQTIVIDYTINQAHGMIGSPTITEVGAIVTTLLRPDFKVNKFFKIDAIAANINIGNQFFRKITRDARGTYRIEKITHKGDSHTDEWQSIIEGITVG